MFETKKAHPVSRKRAWGAALFLLLFLLEQVGGVNTQGNGNYRQKSLYRKLLKKNAVIWQIPHDEQESHFALLTGVFPPIFLQVEHIKIDMPQNPGNATSGTGPFRAVREAGAVLPASCNASKTYQIKGFAGGTGSGRNAVNRRAIRLATSTCAGNFFHAIRIVLSISFQTP